MVFGSRQREFLAASAPPDDEVPPAGHDLIANLAAILSDPARTASLVATLNTASSAYRNVVAEARAEQAKAAAATEQLLAEKKKHADKVAADDAAFDKRVAARELELSAREKRTAELLKSAEADRQKAAEMRTAVERKFKAFDAA